MSNKLLLKKSSVVSRVPLTTDLDYGELAINYADGKLFFKRADESIDYCPSASTLNLYLPLSGGTLSGALKEARGSLTDNTINLDTGNYFTKTISGTTTFSVSNVPPDGVAVAFILDLTNAGSAPITWWSNVMWSGGIAPALTTTGRDVLGFFTHNSGTTWTGLVLGKDIK